MIWKRMTTPMVHLESFSKVGRTAARNGVSTSGALRFLTAPTNSEVKAQNADLSQGKHHFVGHYYRHSDLNDAHHVARGQF
jgi:hypothetical protein